MQLVSYRRRGAAEDLWRAGVAHDGRIVDAATIIPNGSQEWTTRRLLVAGPATLREVFAQAHEAFDAGSSIPTTLLQASDVELGPPVPDPDKIICIGVNYADHASEAGLAQTEVPLFFGKFRNSLTGPTSPIRIPRVSDQIDYEGELAVIIGERCKDVSERESAPVCRGLYAHERCQRARPADADESVHGRQSAGYLRADGAGDGSGVGHSRSPGADTHHTSQRQRRPARQHRDNDFLGRKMCRVSELDHDA